MLYENIQSRMKKMRESLHHTQAHIARAIGIPMNTYNQYETGARKISVENLVKLADFYDVSINYMIGREN